jgi:uncharacterized protein DUF4239
MSDWLLNLPVLWMGVVILGFIYLGTAGIYLLISKLAVGERLKAFKGITPAILPPLSVVFGLLVAFLASQVWGEADKASAAVNREASSLRAVVLLASRFPGDTQTHINRLVHDYIEEAVNQEWPAMARHNATLTIAPPKLAEALQLALTLNPHQPGEVDAQHEMVAALQNALDARRQRIVLSGSSINWVKWTVLLIQAGLTLLTVAMVHCDNPMANRIVLTIFASGVGVAIWLIAANTRPFAGEISVKPNLLLQVMPESGPKGAGP